MVLERDFDSSQQPQVQKNPEVLSESFGFLFSGMKESLFRFFLFLFFNEWRTPLSDVLN